MVKRIFSLGREKSLDGGSAPTRAARLAHLEAQINEEDNASGPKQKPADPATSHNKKRKKCEGAAKLEDNERSHQRANISGLINGATRAGRRDSTQRKDKMEATCQKTS